MNKLKIDFGSGHNPRKGFKTCDITYAPFLDYAFDIKNNIIEGLEKNSVNMFYIRNTLHHIKDLKKVLESLKEYLVDNGSIVIIEPRKEFYKKNIILDNLWYRYIIPRPEIWFSLFYRDYFEILSSIGFQLKKQIIKDEKEITLWKKSKKN